MINLTNYIRDSIFQVIDSLLTLLTRISSIFSLLNHSMPSQVPSMIDSVVIPLVFLRLRLNNSSISNDYNDGKINYLFLDKSYSNLNTNVLMYVFL